MPVQVGGEDVSLDDIVPALNGPVVPILVVEVSRPGESHPEPLAEPYLNVSAHTAPITEPRRSPMCQCAHIFGSRLEIRTIQ